MRNLFKLVNEMTNAVVATFDNYAEALVNADLLNNNSEDYYKVIC